MDRLAGKTAVVMGAASGIGRALADRFVRASMRVVLADVEREPLETALAELRAKGAEVLGVLTDVADREQMDRLAVTALGISEASARTGARTSQNVALRRSVSSSLR
jgi:NAD(P)-dependent dehydrogenase (short-subunit alcohol dehydrogenase family)